MGGVCLESGSEDVSENGEKSGGESGRDDEVLKKSSIYSFNN